MEYTVDESVILAALEKDPKLFKDIKEPSKEMISFMVRNHAQTLIKIWKEIVTPNTFEDEFGVDLEDINYAVKQNPYNIELLKVSGINTEIGVYDTVPTELLAVSKNGLAIKFIFEPPVEIQMIAVENNPEALLHINNPHIDVVKRALELKPDLFKKMDDIQNKLTTFEIIDSLPKDESERIAFEQRFVDSAELIDKLKEFCLETDNNMLHPGFSKLRDLEHKIISIMSRRSIIEDFENNS